MADYKVKISYDDQGAGKKLEELDKKLKGVTKEHKFNVSFPDFDKTKRNLQEVGKYAQIAAQAFKALTPVGRQFAEMEESALLVGRAVKDVGLTLGGLSRYLNPVRGISDGFNVATAAADGLVRSTAQIGFAIFGVTQSVNVLKAAFGGLFNETVGREVRLRETLLQTATTLASTNRLFLEGMEIDDPAAKLKALEKPITESVERIREKSLEIAGTTSEAVIQTFNIIASQIGNFGGTLKDAEQLAAQFAGALGTLGMSDPMYARQEVGSILMGYVDNNSVLAKTLGITNPDIQKAKQSAGGLVAYLNEKLKVFEAGQKQASKGFRGITSNLQELQDELKRSFGAQLLDPILKRMEAFYGMVSGKDTTKQLMQTARAFGQLVGSSANSAVGIASRSSVFQGFDDKTLNNLLKKVQDVFAKIAEYIQNELARIAPAVQRTIDNVVKGVAVLGKALGETAAVLARVKIDQFAVQLQMLSALTPAIVAAANAYSYYLKIVQDILNTPLGRYLNELNATFKVLQQLGVTSIVPLVFAIDTLRKGIPVLIDMLKSMAAAVGNAFQTAAGFISKVITQITTAVTTGVEAAVTAVTTGIARISAMVAQLLGRLSIALNALATKLALGGGAGASLSAPIAAAAKAVDGLAVAFERAEQQATEFGVKTKAAMTQVQTSAAGAAGQVNNLGNNLQNGLTNGAKSAGGALAGLSGTIVANIAKMALWTAAITIVFDLLRRFTEWMEQQEKDEKFAIALDRTNNGLLETVEAARAAGKALDPVTQVLADDSRNQLAQKLDDSKKKALELTAALQRLQAGKIGVQINSLGYEVGGMSSKERAAERAKLQADLDKLNKSMKEYQDLIDRYDGKTPGSGDPTLAPFENKAAIQELAEFEKATRRGIEDEVYNYRRQIQSRELELWRQQGELRIAQVDEANRRLIQGADEQARGALTALANWLSTKRKGELDIEARKREAQMTAAELERNLGRFRMQLEQQLLEVRKKFQQYEIAVLDKRIKGEQLIANIRNGSIQWDSSSGVSGDTGLKMGSTGTSTGPHWHVKGASSEAEARAIFARGREGVLTSPQGWRQHPVHGDRRYHDGWDLSGAALKDLVLAPGYRMVGWRPGSNGGMGNVVVVEKIDSKKVYELGHTATPPAGWSFNQGRGSGSSFTQSDFTSKYMMRLSNLEGGYGAGGASARNPKSNARGYFQLIPKTEQWLRSIGKGDLANRLLSSDFAVASKAAEEFAILSRPAARALFAQGDVGGLDRLLNRTWTSLPGGAEAATGARLAKGNSYLSGAAAGGGGSNAGAAGIAAIGGAPTAPEVTLNIDTSELDSAIKKLTSLNDQMDKLNAQNKAFESEKAFQSFVEQLDTTSADLERAKANLADQETALQMLVDASAKGIYDPKLLEIETQRQTGLNLLARLSASSLEVLNRMKMTDEERKRAQEALNKAYTDNAAKLNETLNIAIKLTEVDRNRAAIQQRQNDYISIQTQLLGEMFDARASAAEAALPENDFLGRRRLQAQRSIYQRYLQDTKGGTQVLTEEEAKSLALFAEQSMAAADSLAALDAELNSFAERLQLARTAATTITDGFKGFASRILQGGDIKEAAAEMMQGIAGRFVDMFLDYAFKPLEQMLEKQFRELFGVDDAQMANTNALQTLTAAVDNLRVTISNPTALGGASVAFGLHPEDAEMLGLTDSSYELVGAFDELDAAMGEMPTSAEQATNALQQTMGGLAGLATGAMAIFAGISQMGKGGTYNTLTGLASIFGGIGAVFGGGFGGFFAEGGSFKGGRPIVVGERGPELILPKAAGTVISNDQISNALEGTRNRLELGGTSSETNQSRSANPETFRLETTVINNVEYATVDQLQRSHERAIKMGRSLALHDIQKSAKVRKRLAI